MPLRDKAQWLAHLAELGMVITLGLDRVREVAERGQWLEWSIPVVTVAGTNGKGSTIAALEGLYLAAGYRVGSYTSPHLLEFNERIRIQGQPVSDEGLCAAFEQVAQYREQVNLSYFEWATLAALSVFHTAHLDVVLLEVGLGGRLDAVNVVDPSVAIITKIALDHQAWLGDDRASIAREKAGIMRAGIPVVYAEDDPPQSLFDCAAALGAEMQPGWVQFAGRDLRTWPLALPHQSVGCALAAIACLQDRLPVSESLIATQLPQLTLAGRWQWWSDAPVATVLDVAHNPDACRALRDRVLAETRVKHWHVVFAVCADKAYREMIEELVPHVQHWFVAPLTDSPRALANEDLITALSEQSAECSAYDSVAVAYQHACEHLPAEGAVLVFGSFLTLAAVLQSV